MEIKEKKIAAQQVAYIEYKGSFEEIPVLMGEVVGFIMAKGLQIMGPPFGVYFNSPQEVPIEELRYEVGMPFEGEAKEVGRVKIKILPEHMAVSAVYKGPYSECGTALGALGQYIHKNGYEIIGPPMEIYISDPNETPENDLITEVRFPVIKEINQGDRMPKLDLKREEKELYNPSRKEPTIVNVPSMNFLMIDGQGDPNTSGEYKDAMEALFPVSYKIKFISKKEKSKDYVVMPLEGLWWVEDMEDFSYRR